MSVDVSVPSAFMDGFGWPSAENGTGCPAGVGRRGLHKATWGGALAAVPRAIRPRNWVV